MSNNKRLISAPPLALLIFPLSPGPSRAAIAFAAASESNTSTTACVSAATCSWTHSPVSTPRGILVFVYTLNSSTAKDTSVTYGGTSMSSISGGTATDTTGEPAVVHTYFLGSAVPTGNQTVVVNRTNDAVEVYAVAFSVTSNNLNTEVYASGIVLIQNDGSYAEQNVDDGSPGSNSVRFAGGFWGGNGVMSAGANSTDGPNIDPGSYTASSAYETTAGQGSRAVGFAQAGNDDRAGVHLAVREIIPTITVSGFIYQSSNETSAYDCSTGGPYTVQLRVNNTGTYTADCTENTGAWSVGSVAATSGQTIYIYLDGESIAGNTVLITDASTQSNVPIFVNRVTLRDDANGSITNSEISTGNTSDADDLITFSGSDITVASSYETHIYTADTYVPGANVSTGQLHIDTSSTYDAGSNTLTLTGTSSTEKLIDRDGTFPQGPSTVSVTSGSGTPPLLTAATTFHILTINAGATVINDGAAITINNAASAALTVTTGVLNLSLTPTGPGAGNGTLTVSSGSTLCLGGSASNTSNTCDSTNTVTTAVTLPTFQTYSLDSAGTVMYVSDAATSVSSTPAYGNLIFNPRFDTTSRIYTLGGAMTINGDFTVNPSESGAGTPALTVNAAGTITVASGKTTSITASDSATSSLDINPGTSYDLSTGLLSIGAGGALDASSSTSTITLTGTSGTLFTRVGTFNITSGTPTVTVTSASGSPTLNSGTITFYNLTINPGSITIATSADDLTVTNTLNVSTNDTLSLASGQDLTHSGATLTLDGTISSSGTLIYQSATAFPTSGTISSALRMDATNNDQTLAGTRTYGGNVEIYNNSGASARNIVLGSAGGQTLTFGGNVTLNAANTQSVTLTGATNTPTVSITGNLTGTSGNGTENITTGSSTTWTVSGNVDFTDIGTFTSTSNTLQMNGSSKTITSAGETLNNFAVTGNSVSNVDNLDVNGTFSVTSGGFTHGAGANIDIFVDGNLAYADNNGTKQSVGNVQIGNSPGVTNLTTDFSANSLTVIAGDVFNTCEYDLDIGNGGITLNTGSPGGTLDTSATGTTISCSANEANETTINDANAFTINSGAVFVQDGSSVIMDDTTGTNAITSNGRSFYNLTVDDGNDDATIIILLEDALDVDNALNIADGTLDVNTTENNSLTVGGNFTNSSTFQARSGTVTFNDATKTSILSYSANTTFFGLTISTSGKQMKFDDAFQTIVAASGSFTVQGSDCTTGRVFLDSETDDNPWDLNVNASATVDIDYADVEDSNSTNAISAANSTQINDSNTNWTITAGACGAAQYFNFDGPLNFDGINLD